MADITVQDIDALAGLEATFGAAAGGGDAFVNDGDVVFVVDNGGGGAVVVTIDSLVVSNYGTDEDIVISVGAGAVAYFPRLDPGRFNDASGKVAITYDGVSSVTVAAIGI